MTERVSLSVIWPWCMLTFSFFFIQCTTKISILETLDCLLKWRKIPLKS